jgi:endonuclease YncB( thermonuclease family)
MFGRNRFRRRRWRGWLIAAALMGLLLVRIWQEADKPVEPDLLDEGPHQVADVIDGDTLRLANLARVRLLGADSPETKHPSLPPQPWGAEATAFTQAFVEGRSLRLAFDRERKDKFGRFLAYVYVGDRLLNEELLRAGLARARLQYPYSAEMKRRFSAAEAEAKTAKRGIWSGRGGEVNWEEAAQADLPAARGAVAGGRLALVGDLHAFWRRQRREHEAERHQRHVRIALPRLLKHAEDQVLGQHLLIDQGDDTADILLIAGGACAQPLLQGLAEADLLARRDLSCRRSREQREHG